jgi:Spy/CpxP family protein refolding chaperone
MGVTAALLLAAATAGWAQHGGHRPDAGAEPHRRLKACATESDAVLREGFGAGLAFAADEHGYPGPVHVLELKDRLALTGEQEARMTALREAMFARARPASARLLDAEARLTALFAAGRADEPSVRAAVAHIEAARTDVRLAHLLTHLATHDALTEPQRRTYHAARWVPR